MSFQFVINNAESIGISSQPVVATTTTRSGLTRATSRGNNIWTFTVRLPNGPRWTDYRNDIAKIEALGLLNTDTIQFNNSGHSWLIDTQGDATTVTATIPSSGNTITLTGGNSTAGDVFKAGDIIQLGASGKCYRVAADVASGGTTLTLHRPLVNDVTGAVTLRHGSQCQWTVRCTSLPSWNLFARDQVGWSGDFVFEEVL